MNILILSGSFGMGHKSASKALEQEFSVSPQCTKVEVIDILEQLVPKHYQAIYDSFDFLVKRINFCYNLFHRITFNSNFNIDSAYSIRIARKIAELIENKNPDLIVSTLPIGSLSVSTYKKKTGDKIPLITCLTDVSTHNEWFTPQTDIYFVPSPKVKASLINKGFNSRNIIVTGIPVKKQFKTGSSCRSINYNNDKHLLVMGGGLGLIPKATEFYEQLNQIANLKTTVILGNNKEDYLKLAGRYENIDIVGYTTQVASFMQRADLMLTKPGGVTLFEAIHAELPILSLRPFLNQEKYNARYIEEEGLGKVLWHENQKIINIIKFLITDQHKINLYRKNIRRVKQKTENCSLYQILNILDLDTAM